MLNMKKGLAIVLAAATALTFAPVASLGTDVSAYAASAVKDSTATTTLTTTGSETLPLTIGSGKKTYLLNISGLGDTSRITVSSEDYSSVVITGQDDARDNDVEINSKTDVINGSKLLIDATASTAAKNFDVTLSWGTNSRYIIHVQLTLPSAEPTFMDSDAANTVTNNGTGFKKLDGTTFTVKQSPADASNTDFLKTLETDKADGATWTITGISGGDNSIVKTVLDTTNGAVKLTFLKPGSTTFDVTVKTTTDATHGQYKAGATKTIKVTFIVIADDSTLKIGGNAATQVNFSTKAVPVLETIYLTGDKPSADLKVTFSDPQYDNEKIKYYGVAKRPNGTAYVGTAVAANDAEVWTNASADGNKAHYTNSDLQINDAGTGTVTATANALNATEQYYDILVTNNLDAGETSKAGVIRVITIRTSKKFTSLKVTTGVDSKIVKTATASYDTNGDVKNGSESVDVTLSTKDLLTMPLSYEANTSKAVEVSNSDSSVVTYDAATKTLTAKKAGSAVLTLKASTDTTYYGNATVTVKVNVDDRYVANPVTVTSENPIVLTKTNKEATIKATCPGGNTLQYKLVALQADGTYADAKDAHLTVDATTGKVTYTGIGSGEAIVEVYGAATTTALAPKAAHVTVQYTDKKADSSFAVTSKKAVNLTVGDTSAITVSGATTGASVAYTSSDDSVASVANGTITAVAPGTAIVTVTDPGNDSIVSKSVDIIVNVKAAPVVYEDPAQVTGVKIKNAKGAKVTVTFKKDKTNPNMKYYVQKQTQKKKSGKSIGSNKTTLSVKSGKSVKVRVKAYYYDANGVKHVGKYSAWTSIFKTDKK